MRSISSIGTLVVGSCLLVAACNAKSTEATDLEGAPELASVEMNLTGSPTTEGLATESDAIDPATLAADELEQAEVPSDTDAVELRQLRGKVRELNGALRDALSPVVAMVRNEAPSRTVGKLKMWGPVVRGATEYRFFLRHAEAHRWGWRLDGRLADSTDAFEPVAAGTIAVGAIAHRGVGAMGFDFDAWSNVDPTVSAQGKILLGFGHGDAGTTVGYAFSDFSYDTQAKPGFDALLRSVRLSNGARRVRMAYYGNVEGTATDAEELVLALVRHFPKLGGRSDVIATQGDVAEGDARVISVCWDKTLTQTFRAVRSCPLDGIGGERCTLIESTGDNDGCPAGLLAAEWAPLDPTEEMEDESDPNTSVTPPTELPVVEAE